MNKLMITMFENGTLRLLLLLALTLAAVFLFTGCSVTKVNYERDEKGVVSYRLYRNSHWLKMEGEGMRGGMSKDGKFEFDLEGMKSSPSEEFNRVMMTYTTAFVQLAQIAAAAYNPSASAATKSAGPTVVNVQPTPADQSNTQTTKQSNNLSPDCPDGSCKDVDSAACTGDACKDK